MKQLLQREAEAQKGEGAANDAEKSGGASGAPWFADALLKQAGGELSAWACKNRGSFVVAALEGVPSASAGVRKVLGAKAAKAQLVKDAKAGGSMGAKVRWACEYHATLPVGCLICSLPAPFLRASCPGTQLFFRSPRPIDLCNSGVNLVVLLTERFFIMTLRCAGAGRAARLRRLRSQRSRHGTGREAISEKVEIIGSGIVDASPTLDRACGWQPLDGRRSVLYHLQDFGGGSSQDDRPRVAASVCLPPGVDSEGCSFTTSRATLYNVVEVVSLATNCFAFSRDNVDCGLFWIGLGERGEIPSGETKNKSLSGGSILRETMVEKTLLFYPLLSKK